VVAVDFQSEGAYFVQQEHEAGQMSKLIQILTNCHVALFQS
jgi:hypothetical protein